VVCVLNKIRYDIDTKTQLPCEKGYLGLRLV